MKNRYLIFTNKEDGLIDLLEFSRDVDLFNDDNNLCVFHSSENNWEKKHCKSNNVSSEKLQSINMDDELIIVADDEIKSLERIAPLFDNMNECYVILHERTKPTNKDALDNLNIQITQSKSESHVSDTFYDLHLRKLFEEEITENTIEEIQRYFEEDGTPNDKEEKVLRAKLKILHKILENENTSLADIQKEYDQVSINDKKQIDKYLESRNINELRRSILENN